MTKRDGEPKDGGVRKAGTLVVSADSSEDGADLESLAEAVGDTASIPPGEPDDDDGRLDLSRLSASALGRASGGPDAERASARDAPAPTASARAEPASRVPDAEPGPAGSAAAGASTGSAGARWLLPLAAGFGLGLAVGAVAFGGSTGVPPASGSAAASQPTAADVPPARAPALPPGVPEPAGEPAVGAAPVAATTVGPDTSGAVPAAAASAGPGLAHGGASRGAAASPRPIAVPAAQPLSDSLYAEADAPVVRLTPKAAEPAAAEPAAEAAAKSSPGGPRSVDQLLDEALTGDDPLSAAAARRKQAAAQSAGLPATPSREEVTQAMAVLLPAIRGCAMGQSGMATAGIVVRNDGRVASVSVTGAPFAGSASGRCMEGVVRRARFPRFQQPTFRVRYPLAIQ